jgi:hypothetical protein
MGGTTPRPIILRSSEAGEASWVSPAVEADAAFAEIPDADRGSLDARRCFCLDFFETAMLSPFGKIVLAPAQCQSPSQQSVVLIKRDGRFA